MDTDSTYPDQPISDNCSINLNILQYIFYRSGRIDVLSPDDMLLETIGYEIKAGGL